MFMQASSQLHPHLESLSLLVFPTLRIPKKNDRPLNILLNTHDTLKLDRCTLTAANVGLGNGRSGGVGRGLAGSA